MTNSKLAGFLAIAATVAMPVVALPAMAQTAPKSTTPAAPMTPTTPGASNTGAAANAPMDKDTTKNTTTMTTPAAPATTAPMGTATTTTPRTNASNDIATAGGDRASKIIGASVVNNNKETVGTVDDLIIASDEKIPSAVLSVGGFLGIGTKYVEVPFDQLKIANGDVMMAGATKESLKKLPEFKYDSK